MSTVATAAPDRLKEGIRRFQTEVYPDQSEAYQYAATHPQKPHTLVITCSDSRIDIETVTGSKPGEIFVARNVGNIVPAYESTQGGVAAVIEYAVNALKVQHVVVCGHSDCGAMKAVKANDSGLDALPAVKHWLSDNAMEARSAALSPGAETPELPTLTEKNVLLQLTHLETHPAVRDAKARGELTVGGWVYDIATGDVRIHDQRTGRFEPTLGNNGGTAMRGASA